MNGQAFLNALEDVIKEKGIDKEVVFEAMELALQSAYKKHYNQQAEVRVQLDKQTGEIRVFSQTLVVEEIELEDSQITLEEARAINVNYELGDVIEEEADTSEFGRVAAQTAKQVVIQKIREAERESIFEEFISLEGDVVNGIIGREDVRNYYVDLGRAHAILPKIEVIPGEKVRIDQNIKVYVSKVERTSKLPLILVTRKAPGILRKLLEVNVPEIAEGIVELHAVSREAGERSKIAVSSLRDEIDPVGACIGSKGSRINAIIRDLGGEKIDVIEYNSDPALFIKNALSPAFVTDVKILDIKENTSLAIVPDSQLSLAIGKRGQNAKLSARLTGWKIDIKSQSQADELGIEYPKVFQ